MDQMLPPTRNLTGYRWHIDVHVLDHPAAEDLRRLGALGWVNLGVADTALTEVLRTADEVKRERLLSALQPYPIVMGPTVPGHSVLGYSVNGSDEDDGRIRSVYANISPGNDFQSDANMQSSNGRARFRDSLHVATAIRYNASAFITEDRRLRDAAPGVAAAFEGFALWSVDVATKSALHAVRNARFHTQRTGRPDPNELPDWPEREA